jgi:hypothetical protein
LNQFNQHRISNGDKVIVFKRTSVVAFIKNYKNLFEINTPEIKTRALRNKDGGKKSNISSTGKIRFINDLTVMKKVEKYLSANNIIDAVLFCSNYYAKEFPKMKLSDWTLLIKKMNGKDVVLLR